MGKIVIKTEDLYKMFHIGSSEKFTIFTSLRYKLSGETPKRTLWALKNINITVDQGEMIAVIGPNGSGKTTLLRILSGIMTQTSGQYQVDGRISVIFELGLGFNPRFTALQNVYLYGALHGFSRREIDRMMPQIVEYSELHEFMGAKLCEFSSGMRQRLAFATIIQTVENIVIVDEVMSVGDQSFKRKCFNSYKKILDEGKTILFVTQELDGELKNMCSKALYLNNGEQRFFGSAEKAVDLYNKDSCS